MGQTKIGQAKNRKRSNTTNIIARLCLGAFENVKLNSKF